MRLRVTVGSFIAFNFFAINMFVSINGRNCIALWSMNMEHVLRKDAILISEKQLLPFVAIFFGYLRNNFHAA